MSSMADCGHSSSGVAAVSGENSNSPQSRRGSLSSPLPEVVRGEQGPTWVVRHSPPSSVSSLSSLAMEQTPFVDDSATQVARSPFPLPPENSASAENSDENHVNTAARNEKPADGVVEVGPAKAAVASPELSESAEASPRLQDESSWRAASDASTSTQVPVNLFHHQKHVASNATPNSTTNHAMPVQPRFNPRGIPSGNGGRPRHGGFIRPSQAPASSFPMFQMPRNSYGNLVPPTSDTSFREPSYLSNNCNPKLIRGHLPQPHQVDNHHGMSQRGNINPYMHQPHPVNDHHGMSPRGNINPYMHGNSVHHNNENRVDPNRGSFVNGRNVHMHHSRSCWGPSTSSPYMPPTHFFSPQPVRAYGNHMFNQVPFNAITLEHHRGPQFMPRHPIIQSVSEPPVSTLLVNQINYYFCDANLVYDNFLKSHMDDQGWVSIDLIAGFPKVKTLTNDIRLILDSLRTSAVVEVQGDKIRRRHEWINWIPNKNSTPALSLSKSTQDLLTNVQNLKIEEVVSERVDDNGKMKELPNGENSQNAENDRRQT